MKRHDQPAGTWARGMMVFLCLCLGLAARLQAQVIGNWNFDEKSPGNTADTTTNALADASGNGYSGTMSDPGVLYVAGNANYGSGAALRFTLGPDHVAVPDPTGTFNFSPGQSVTLETMIKTVNIGEDGVGSLMSKQGASPGEWWWRINANGRQQFYINDGAEGAKSVSGTRVLNDGQWHHLAAVYDATAHQLRIYADYALDASATAAFTTSGTIGNALDLWIAAFQAGSRQFDGDFDFARFSYGALAPADFVHPVTYITGFTPTNGASFVPAATVAGFEVLSAMVGVPATNVQAVLNGSNITSQLTLSGTVNDWLVTLPALTANRIYHLEALVTDQNGYQARATNVFNTFSDGLFSFEAEDYNFDGGQFIDHPELTSFDGPNSYLDRMGVEGIDFHKTNTPPVTQYRIGDGVGTAITADDLRQEYVTAQQTDLGVADYMVRDIANGDWLNYTRTFPANTYHVYARLAKAGTVPMMVGLDEVTDGSTTSSQTLVPIGRIISAPTLNAQTYVMAPLTDALGREIGLPLSGVKTLRATMISGTAGMTANYFIFVPQGGVQVPFVAGLSPAAGADNEQTNVPVHITIRNGDTSVNTASIVLRMDGANVTGASTITATATGAQVDYAPASLGLGLHTASLEFTDSAVVSTTNTWQFRVANQAVRGQWTFNEKAPGNAVGVNAGAILDTSGNNRNGTANDATQQYVTGSFNYGNTPALRFTTGPDRVVVPDAAGSFNYRGSFTWEAVVRTVSTATMPAILAKNGTGDGEGEYWWRLPGAAGGVQYVGMNDGYGAKFATGTNVLNDGNWHHLAVVYDTNTAEIRLYADYKLDGTQSNMVFTGTIGRPADLQIGSFIGGGSEFDGDIDTIRISSGALTPAQFIQTTVALAPLAKAVRPGTNATHVFPTTLIGMDVQNRDTQVAPASVKVFVDGADVSAGAATLTNATGATIQYQPAFPLADGLHTVRITFNDTAFPANAVTNQWQFSVVGIEPVVGFYQFNEQAAGGTDSGVAGAIRDSSGNLRAGTVASAGLPYVAGSPSYGATPALEFTGTTAPNHISVPDPSGAFNFTPAKSITLEAIIKTVNIGQASVGSLMAKQSVPPPEWWWRINANGFQQFNINDGTAAKSVNGAKKLNDGQWHHVAVVYDAAAKQLRAYVDYALDGNPTATTYTGTNNVIGNAQDLWLAAFQAGNRLFDGDIDAMRITAAPLDPSWFIPLGGIVDRVRLMDVTSDAASVSFSFVTEAGRSYTVQWSPDLGTTWMDLETMAGDGSNKSVSYLRGGAKGFFRVSAH